MDELVKQRITIRLWGDFRVVDATGAPVEMSNRKARACLAFLACAAGATISRDRLASMLWGNRSDTQARANLRQLLYEMKPLTQASCPLLGFDRHGAWLDPGCDLDTSALQRSEASELADSLPARGEMYLADLDGVSDEFDDWLAPERASAEAALRRLVQMRIEACFAQRDFAVVRALTDAWAARDATDETLAQFGLRADAGLMDAAGLARRLNNLASALAIELGVKTSAATANLARDLIAGIQAHGVERAPAAGRMPVTHSRRSRRAASWKWSIGAALVLAGIGLSIRFIPALAPPSNARAEAERLTTSARELSHGRTRTGYAQAASLARRAIAADPTYAPAWAELGMASYMPAQWRETREPGSETKIRADVLGYLDRAEALQPGLGRALSIRGMIVGGPAATPMLESAVVDAPDDAEAWLWLCNQRLEFGSAHEALVACRRTAELAPLWDRSVRAYASSALQAGEDAAAVDKVLDRFAAVSANRYSAESLRASVAAERGDLLGAADHGSRALAFAPDDPWIQIIELALIARAVGDTDAVRRLTSEHRELKSRFAPVFEPDNAVARAQDASAWWSSPFQEDEARRLLRAGRADLLLGLVKQQALSILELNRGHTWGGMSLRVQLALALRSSGRDEEAETLIDAMRHDVSRLADGRFARFELDLATAAVCALDARDQEAVAVLDRAVDKGWRGQSSDWAVDPGDEPVFAHLRGRTDFERVRARLAAEIERVRPRINQILAATPIPVVKDVVAEDF